MLGPIERGLGGAKVGGGVGVKVLVDWGRRTEDGAGGGSDMAPLVRRRV